MEHSGSSLERSSFNLRFSLLLALILGTALSVINFFQVDPIFSVGAVFSSLISSIIWYKFHGKWQIIASFLATPILCFILALGITLLCIFAQNKNSPGTFSGMDMRYISLLCAELGLIGSVATAGILSILGNMSYDEDLNEQKHSIQLAALLGAALIPFLVLGTLGFIPAFLLCFLGNALVSYCSSAIWLKYFGKWRIVRSFIVIPILSGLIYSMVASLAACIAYRGDMLGTDNLLILVFGAALGAISSLVTVAILALGESSLPVKHS